MPKVGSGAWAGKVICEYQPWFSVNSQSTFNGNVGPFNGHINIGYDEDANDSNNPFNSAASTQNSAMISQGCNIDLINFYGFNEPIEDFNQDTTTNSVYADLASRGSNGSYPMQFAIMEDKGAFSEACDATGNESDEITCIENDLLSDMTQAYENYIQPHPSLYWTDSSTGTARNVVAIFAACGDFKYLVCPTKTNPQDDWQTIWNVVFPEIANLSYNMEFIFEYGTFGYPSTTFGYPSTTPSGAPSYLNAGQYAWPQPFSGFANGPDCQSAKDCFIDNPTTQFWWCDSGNGGTELPCQGEGSGSKAYLDRFYTDAATNVPKGQIAVGVLYKGFDDSNANWWSDRVIAQQCGQVLLGTAGELTYEANSANTSYWASHQMPYMQVATWNDYEEGTEVESGINNCYSGITPTINMTQTTLSWSLTASDTTYATTKSIYGYALWTAPHNQDNITLRAIVTPASKMSVSLPQLNVPPGQDVDIYVEMIGQPLIQDLMSATSVEWTAP